MIHKTFIYNGVDLANSWEFHKCILFAIKKGIEMNEFPSDNLHKFYICHKFLYYFKNQTKKEKINELIRISKIKFSVNQKQYLYKRLRKHPVINLVPCWVCLDNPAYCMHHIIQLYHGGYNTKENLIPICDKCHAEIHSHLNFNDKALLHKSMFCSI